MRLDFSWSLPCSASILAGVMLVTAGCSSSPDKNAGASGAGPAAAPSAQTEKPAISTEKRAEPVKPLETPPATAPDSNDMPVPTTPVRPQLPRSEEPRPILQPVVPDTPAVNPVKTEPPKSDSPPKTEAPKTETSKTEPVKTETPGTDKVDDLVPAMPKRSE
ncbi:MAG: hypothetical protein ACLP9L_40105 [Thermoguttaceae bacterium]